MQAPYFIVVAGILSISGAPRSIPHSILRGLPGGHEHFAGSALIRRSPLTGRTAGEK
jgi:hypothetical protein